MSESTPLVYAALAAAGVSTHILYFNRNEHHLNGVRYLQIATAVFITGVAVMTRINGEAFMTAFVNMAKLQGVYLAGVFASLLTYRMFFHPLNKFPGPFGARISNFYHTFHLGKADAHKRLLKLHEQYGPFVRVGSSDLSINHPAGPGAVYGPGTKCVKGPWYDNDKPLTSMHTTRERQLHDRRRRVWSSAFSDKALRGYEDRILGLGEKLVDSLRDFAGKPLNATKYFNLYSYDVMGDLAFAKNFGMLESGQEHFAIKLLNEGMEPLALNLPPWFFRVLTAIPGLSAGYWKFIYYCNQKLDERWDTKVKTPDIMSVLLEPFKNGKPVGKELTMLHADARLIIVAGSDTTAATLTYVFYHLARDPKQQQKLREELGPHMDANHQVKHVDIQNCDHLNGVINEALRLNPPVPSAVYRLTPPEGVDIGGEHIPGNMTVYCPQYVISRNPDAYERPEEFYPERWYKEEDMIKNKTAFAPFSQGVYGCIGKPLALMELRTIIARILDEFDVSFAPGEDGRALLHDTRDHFTLGLAPLNLCFTPKK